MSKTSYLIKNTGILAIGSFSSKLLVFLMVPIYTSALTTAEYGMYDIIYSSVGLLIPILTLNIADALLRFPLDEDADTPRIARIGLCITLISGVFVLVAQLVPIMPWHDVAGVNWLAPLYLANAFYQVLILLARGCERMADVAIAGVISTVTMLSLNVILLLVAKLGLAGFFMANVAGLTVPSIYLISRMRNVIFAPAKTSSNGLLASMIRYSMPLAATTIGWWFINTSGRFAVMALCGAGAAGLFSIAYKIPSILNVISGIFIQAWQVSAIKEFDRKDSDGFLRDTFAVVETGLIFATSALILLSPVLASVLYSGEFYEGWRYVPLLLVSSLLNTMGGMWGPFFSAKFDTAPIAVSTALGGAINVVACLALIGFAGVQGAAFASVLASLVNWAWRGIKVKKHIDVDFHMGKSLLAYGTLVIQGTALTAGLPTGACTGAQIACLAGLVLLSRKSLTKTLSLIRKSINGKIRHH